MPEEKDEIQPPQFVRPIGIVRTQGRKASADPRRGTIGVLPRFKGLLDLRMKPGDRLFSTLSYLILRPLLIGESSETNDSRIGRSGWNDPDGMDAVRIPKVVVEEWTTDPASAQFALSFLTLRPPVIEGISGRPSGGGVSNRIGPVGRRAGDAPARTRAARSRDRGVDRISTADWNASDGRAGRGPSSKRTSEINSAGSTLSFLTLQSLIVRNFSEFASRWEGGPSGGPEMMTSNGTGIDRDLEVSQAWSEAPEGSDQEPSFPETTEGRTAERVASISTANEGFPRERTYRVSDTERLRSGITEWEPPLLERREATSAEGPQTSVSSMAIIEKTNAGVPPADAEPSEMGSETPRSSTRRPGGEESTPQIGRSRNSTSEGRPRTALRDSPPDLAVPGTPMVRAPRTTTVSDQDPEMIFKHSQSGATVGREETARAGEASGGLEGAELSRSGRQEHGSRKQGDDTPSVAAPSLEQIVDIDRFVDRLYRRLERKQRIERERRGL